MHIDLPVIWAAIIGLGVFIYVMLDGFDLGIGLLFPFFDAKAERQVMLDTVAPVWDGNETFLVLGGAGKPARSRSCIRRCCRRTTCRWC